MLLEVTVKENDANQRVDRYVRRLCPGLSLSRLHYLFRKKEIKIESRPAARNGLLRAGDCLRVYGLKEFEGRTVSLSKRPSWKRETFNLPIIYEDESLLVINKPGNITVHPGSGVSSGASVIEKVRRRYNMDADQMFKPSLIHRLDKETSGVLLVAKTGNALRHWTGELRKKSVEKTYHALVIGSPDGAVGVINRPLARIDSRRGGAKSVVDADKGKATRTLFKVLKKVGRCTLLEVSIETGRMHQIRAHLAHCGLQILGDTRYGDFSANKDARIKYKLRRAFLHAFRWRGIAESGKKVIFRADLAHDLKLCLAEMEGNREN